MENSNDLAKIDFNSTQELVGVDYLLALDKRDLTDFLKKAKPEADTVTDFVDRVISYKEIIEKTEEMADTWGAAKQTRPLSEKQRISAEKRIRH